MNIRLTIVIVFVIIILGGLGFFFMNEKNTKELTERINAPAVEDPTTYEQNISVESFDKRVHFTYPSTWTLGDTTKTTVKGKFGKVLQSWTLGSPIASTSSSDSVPEDAATMTITIQDGGSNLPIESLLDCSMKTITCEKIGIDNEQFMKSDTVLNTGVRHMGVATFYDDKILTAEAVIAPGPDRENLATKVERILMSFTFSDITPTNP